MQFFDFENDIIPTATIMNPAEQVVNIARNMLNYDMSRFANLCGEFAEIVSVGYLINNAVKANIHNKAILDFINKVIDLDMRDSELVRLYIQLAVRGFINPKADYVTSTWLDIIRNKVKEFENWTIVTIFDVSSLADDVMMERGTYPVDIHLGDKYYDQGYIQYLCKDETPNVNRVDYYLARHVSNLYKPEYINESIARDLVLTGDETQFDIIPRHKIVQENYACFQGCVMYLKDQHKDVSRDVLLKDRKVMYWYHNGYKIQCSKSNQFNMFEVNAELDGIIKS